MFYSRIKELEQLKEFFKKPNQALALYGKRRVGKTALILNADKGNKTFIYFECLKDNLEINVMLFVDQCKKMGIKFPQYFKAESFIEVFEYLNSLSQDIIIAIDEYPYLRSFTDSNIIDSAFQYIIDNHLENINLIISGSEIKMMEQIINEKNPLYGRFSSTILLEELNYIEAANFYSNKSIYDKIGFYSVFGGSPFINNFIDPDKSLKENIIKTYLLSGSAVYNYADSILISDVANELNAKRILSYIANGKKRHKDIINSLDFNKTGLLSKSLNSLVELKLLKKREPINKLGDAKKTHYEICDNVLRFYYTYIYRNKTQLEILGPDAFYDEYIEPTIANYISYRFEEQCRTYFSLLVKNRTLKNIKNIGTYYYDDKENKTNGEFDIVIETQKGFDIFEAKYLKEPLLYKSMLIEKEQIEKIIEIKVENIGFVSASGFKEKTNEFICIEGKDLYNIREVK